MGYTNFDNCNFDKTANFVSICSEEGSNFSLKYSTFGKLIILWKKIEDKLAYDGSNIFGTS